MSIATEVMLGIAGPSLRQGAAGTVYFEPGGVSFWDYQRPNRRRWLASHWRSNAFSLSRRGSRPQLVNKDRSEEAQFPRRRHGPETHGLYASSIHFRIGNFAMTAIVLSFIRSATRESDLAVVTAASLAGVLLSLVLIFFGPDLGTNIPG